MAIKPQADDKARQYALIVKHNALLQALLNGGVVSYPHYDVSSTTGGDALLPVDVPLAITDTTPAPDLPSVVLGAEHARSLLLQHFADTFDLLGAGAHRTADAVNADLISYAALAPLLPVTSIEVALPVTVTGSGATYASVTAAHTLTLSFGGFQTTVTFAGTENTQALFHAAINAALPAGNFGGIARNNGGQTQLVSNQKGTGPNQLGTAPIGAVVAGNADVLTSLGLTVGALALVAPVTQPATQSQANALLNAIQTAYNAHRTTTAHVTNDTVNVSSAAAATDLASSKTLFTDIKTQTNAHILSALGSLMIR